MHVETTFHRVTIRIAEWVFSVQFFTVEDIDEERNGVEVRNGQPHVMNVACRQRVAGCRSCYAGRSPLLFSLLSTLFSLVRISSTASCAKILANGKSNSDRIDR
ncbi:hypothetical protein ACFQL7_28470 [Halocatena marina]|uniref:Uncharacterized protein n=1 Tax=Halocatena marina TaxID=2934937 RepID=A0ABD5YVJ7_9EURY